MTQRRSCADEVRRILTRDRPESYLSATVSKPRRTDFIQQLLQFRRAAAANGPRMLVETVPRRVGHTHVLAFGAGLVDLGDYG